ncbi:MAG: hypothetical protein LBS70_02170 [Candidatus Accumulibacter sp.]|jgi:hypothetical protein|nr:hypothetical protein [Accumulibacter sp.]
MRVRFSEKAQAVMAVAGHAGSGHCHSHNQYLQDDSGGLAAVLALFQEATGLSLTIREIRATTGVHGSLTVETVSGGIATCAPRRGVTIQEARLAKSLEGRDARRTQALALEAFGRFYGQGIHETPVALQTAIANAAVDSFVRNFPDRFVHAHEDIAGCCGRIAGTVLDFDGIPVAVLATVNAAPDGIGPVEDMEGNALVGAKADVMRRLGMADIPTLVIEGKVYAPAYSDHVEEAYFLVRADPMDDNPVVADAMWRAAQNLGYAVAKRDDVMRRTPGALESGTRALGLAIAEAGRELQEARFAQEKAVVLSKLARLVSEDGAGISFMSDRLHEIIGGTGNMPGTGAVLSRIVPKSYRDAYVFPFLTEGDVAHYVTLIKASVRELNAVLPQALAHLKEHAYTGDCNRFVRFPA